ncbi:hypothetical protein [Rhodococcus sp. KRD162]|jgi:hypothetical protein|uniref:hypothetical protein n=1 Tax=Rhodococcus sp. KRD162 TaxID=2729725 RepID=UPI0019D2A9CF|nr:hypothetical protein [Rhodococcus sp. KRD162]
MLPPVSGQALKFTPARLSAYLEVIQARSYRAAASQSAKSEAAYRLAVSELQGYVNGGALLKKSPDGTLVPTSLGTTVQRQAEQILRFCEGLTEMTTPSATVSFLPHHTQFLARAIARVERARNATPQSTTQVTIQILPDRYRSTEMFNRQAIEPLRAGLLDLVVGPPPDIRNVSGSVRLENTLLYTPHLQAMLSRRDPRQSLRTSELGTTPLLLPPNAARSYQLLLHALRRDDPHAILTTAQQAWETNVLVTLGREHLGTVIVGSDIACMYKQQHEFAGKDAKKFKWVPVLDSNHEKLSYEVHLTRRADDEDPLIRRMTDEIMDSAEHLRPDLEGATL